MSEFLTGKNQPLPTKDEYEVVAYIMNGKIDWSALNNKGRRDFINALHSSNIFNMGSNFWKTRLRDA